MRRLRIGDYLVYLAVRLLICIVQAMRIETGQVLAGHLAWLFSDVLRIRSQVVEENLRHAFPETTEPQRRRLARRMWEHLLLLVLEVAHVPRKIHETNWRRYVRLKDHRRMVQILLDDRPSLIVTGHFGNFEVGGVMLGLLGIPSFTIARSLDNPYLDRFLNRFRGMSGQHIIPKKGGYDRILQVMADHGTLTFLADQAAGPKGCWVEFFGRPASAHKAIALLALDNDAPLVVTYARRRGRPLQFELGCAGIADPRAAGDEVGSVRDLTQWYTDRLEAFIRRDPGQYWWVHRRWKDSRSRRARRRKNAA